MAYADKSSALDAGLRDLPQPLLLLDDTVYFEDLTGNLTIDDITRSEITNRFHPLQGKALNTGLSDSAFWLYLDLSEFEVERLAKHATHWLVEFESPYLNYLDVYLFDPHTNQLIQHWQTGDKLGFNSRPVPATNFVFPLALMQGQPLAIIARLQNDGLVVANPKLWQRDAYLGVVDGRAKLYGLFYGAMLIMALYNFIIYLSMGDKTYLYYVLSVLGVTVFEICQRGDALRYLWPNVPSIPNLLLVESIFFAEVFTLLFIHRFLQLNVFLRYWGQAIQSLALLSAVMILVAFFIPNRLAVNVAAIIAMSVSVMAVIVGFMRAYAGSRSAKVFLAAWGLLLVAIFITALMRFIPMPVNVITTNLISVGLIVQVALLSLALADKFNRIQREAKDTLQVAVDKLEQTNLVKDQFLSTISHELRTPMNGIEGALSLVDSDKLSDADGLYLSTAKSSAKDMTAMIDAVLRFNEMQAGSIVLKSEPFNPVSFFNGIALLVEERCQRKGIVFNSKIPQSSLVLKGDPEQLRLVLLQLGDNAVKFTETRGKVSLAVDLELTGGWGALKIVVEDNGQGISEEVKGHLFGAKAKTLSLKSGGGLGIGLTLCHYLIDKMGGSLQIDSLSPQGTRVLVMLHLPVLAHMVEPQKNPPVLHELPQCVVLVVEDNPVNQQVMRGILNKLGYHSLYADNGKEALDMLEAHHIDLVFMDCQMPVMDGFEATRKIRQMLKLEVPIIAITANAMSTDKEKCMQVGMNDYLAKPIQLDQIRQLILRWHPEAS